MTAIPCAPSYFLGVCVTSGSVVTLVNTGEFFKLRSVVATDMRNAVVISDGTRSLAFGARDLLGIQEIEETALQNIQHPSECVTHALGGRLLIDPARVFADPRLAGLVES